MEQLELLILLIMLWLFVAYLVKYEVPWKEDYSYLEVAIAYDIKRVAFYEQGPLYQPRNLSILHHRSATIDALLK
ncbi:MAG: hypothetical protein GXN92_01515 [Candidatus Micrarchaeota archaeon]|nr:hypothetical protein [Candidatus Micrarchaeota archaeon]